MQFTTFRLWDVVSYLKVEWRHDILTPGDPAFVLEQPVTAMQKPDLLSESSRYLKLHIVHGKFVFRFKKNI
jgi:hypothetical protein